MAALRAARVGPLGGDPGPKRTRVWTLSKNDGQYLAKTPSAMFGNGNVEITVDTAAILFQLNRDSKRSRKVERELTASMKSIKAQLTELQEGVDRGKFDYNEYKST
jgi:hypothetical protein